jgi:hypothetical protein
MISRFRKLPKPKVTDTHLAAFFALACTIQAAISTAQLLAML